VSDVPVGAQWVPEGTPDATPEAPLLPEFERVGSPSLEDYIIGLKHEFELATGAARKAIKAELDRVAGPRHVQTAVAPKAEETA
jgi:hypothetical protein